MEHGPTVSAAECCCMLAVLAVLACRMLSACKQESPLCALLYPALLSSHTQWPFCLRWWIRKKCCVSTFVAHAVSCLPLSSCLCFLCSLSHTWAPEGQLLTLLLGTCARLMSAHVGLRVCMCRLVSTSSALSHFFWPLHDVTSPVEFPSYFVTVLCPCGWCWVLLLLSLVYVCVCVSSLQARVKNEILDYKDLAALPKVKAIYEVQQPDLISSSYQPYHRYTSDDRLDTYSYGEVLLPHTSGQT